jgi:predicted protein tyrosine phosphatase
MMTSRSLICLLENQNGGKLQKQYYGALKYQRHLCCQTYVPNLYKNMTSKFQKGVFTCGKN